MSLPLIPGHMNSLHMPKHCLPKTYSSIYTCIIHIRHGTYPAVQKKFSVAAGQMTEPSTCTLLIAFWRIKNTHRLNQFYITHIGQQYQPDLVKVNEVHPRTGHKGLARESWFRYTLSLASALDGVRRSTPRSYRFTPGKETLYSLYGRLGGPQGRSGWVRTISPPPGFDPRTVQPRLTSPLNFVFRN
jgi:hypothetical protein